MRGGGTVAALGVGRGGARGRGRGRRRHAALAPDAREDLAHEVVLRLLQLRLALAPLHELALAPHVRHLPFTNKPQMSMRIENEERMQKIKALCFTMYFINFSLSDTLIGLNTYFIVIKA